MSSSRRSEWSTRQDHRPATLRPCFISWPQNRWRRRLARRGKSRRLRDELVLVYELDGEKRERREATCFIAARIETEGIIRRRIGTAHLELDESGEWPHWYALGPRLAAFLEVPALGDAFALLLSTA